MSPIHAVHKVPLTQEQQTTLAPLFQALASAGAGGAVLLAATAHNFSGRIISADDCQVINLLLTGHLCERRVTTLRLFDRAKGPQQHGAPQPKFATPPALALIR